MDPALLTAVITAACAVFASLIASLIAASSSRSTQRGQAKNSQELVQLKDRLDTESTHRERQLGARAELENLREPLLGAAKDLQQRIWNIRENYFVAHLNSDDDHRRDVALLGTLHRFARYWALQELFYSRTHLLRFESDGDTQDVAELVGSIARAFASDSKEGLNLIFWREEQRAVAELMVDFGSKSPVPPITGFATFRNRYQEDARREDAKDFALWFAGFARDLQAPTISENRRLGELDDKLTDLVTALEKGRIVNQSGVSASDAGHHGSAARATRTARQ